MRRLTRNSSRSRERAHAQAAGPDPLQHVRVRARAHRQVVLAREAQRLVVVLLEKEPGVVDLEHVDVGQVAVDRLRIGDRVHPVERVGEVHEAALLLDRGDRVREGHAPGDLALEEEADHLALVVRLDLLARDHEEIRPARGLHRRLGAAEGVVVGDRDRAEPLGDRVLDELLRLDEAVVRPRGVHVEVDRDPGAVGERVGIPRAAPASGERAVELVQLPPQRGEALGSRRSCVLRQPNRRGARGSRRVGRRRRPPAQAARARPAVRRSPRPRRSPRG